MSRADELRAPTCPRCNNAGRSVSGRTVAFHVDDRSGVAIDGSDGWRMCRSPACEVGYYDGVGELLLGDLRSVPFFKSDDPDRVVCFCFGHTAADLSEDLTAHGRSTIQAAIKSACRAGLDDCEQNNPEGRCCLGNVGAILRNAKPVGSTRNDRADGAHGCCSVAEAPVMVAEPALDGPAKTTTKTARPRKSGAGLVFAAVGAAGLSSACCWLPLVLIGLGVSSTGVGAIFEAWRWPLLAATLGLLGVGFYVVYVRRPACGPGDACEEPRSSSRRNRLSLWFATVAVGALALFPEYVAAFDAVPPSHALEAQEKQVKVVYAISGMTCGGCAAHVRQQLEEIEGVISAIVSYEDAEAVVVWRAAPEDAEVTAALARLGYETHRKGGAG